MIDQPAVNPPWQHVVRIAGRAGHRGGFRPLELLLPIGVKIALLVALPAASGLSHSSSRAWSQGAVAAPEDLNAAFLDKDLKPEEWVERFEVESREVYAARNEIVDALRLGPGTRIGDIGCGTGLFVPLFADKVGAEGQIYAVDISPKLLEFVRKRVGEAKLKQVKVIQCEADNVNLPEGSIDVAFICDTYHHFEFPQATLQSLRFALRPGGHLFVIDFERIPGTSREWTLDHVRADKETFRREIEQAGFVFEREVNLDKFEENYFLQFRRP